MVSGYVHCVVAYMRCHTCVPLNLLQLPLDLLLLVLQGCDVLGTLAGGTRVHTGTETQAQTDQNMASMSHSDTELTHTQTHTQTKELTSTSS